MSEKPLLLLGSTGLVGRYLLEELTAAGQTVVAVSRKPFPPSIPRGVTWHQADLADPSALESLPVCNNIISTLSIWMTAEVAKHQSNKALSRVVAFSSTSALAKIDARDRDERVLAERLLAGEDALKSLAPTVTSTILRPTMIYGRRGDRNIERIAGQLTRSPFFPLVGGGRGLRQPVHAQDLAIAAAKVVLQPTTEGRTYELGGAEVLPVRDMVARVGRANGTTVRFVSIPLPLARRLLIAARVFPRLRGIPVGAVDRMAKDLVFDYGAATEDFGYAPRPFEPPDYQAHP